MAKTYHIFIERLTDYELAFRSANSRPELKTKLLEYLNENHIHPDWAKQYSISDLRKKLRKQFIIGEILENEDSEIWVR